MTLNPEFGIPAADGIYGWVDERQYHADRGSLSVSGAKLLLPPSCPAKFKEHMDNPPKPKRIYEFGHLAHLEILGKGVETVEIDADDYRTKAAREKRDRARANGKVPVLIGADANDDFYAELGKARSMAEAVFNHPEAGPLFADPSGRSEMAMYTTDPETGVRLRGRADRITDTHIIDVKTAASVNPNELERQFWKFRYFMQHSWYVDLASAIGLGDLTFVFVAVEKEPPYLVTVVEYDSDAVIEGRAANRRAIKLFAECQASNEWPGYTRGRHRMSLPRYAPRITRTQHDEDRAATDAAAAALIAELETIA